MSFNTALSGLNAASNTLDVTGNNIANANTTGFKESRVEFADVYATSLGGVAKNAPGVGVRVTQAAQQFGQGVLEFTENSLDLAISGEGFFVMGEDSNDPSSHLYTRSGAFAVNRDGHVVNHAGHPLLAYQPNGTSIDEGFSRGVLEPVRLDVTEGVPTATKTVNAQLNLDSSAAQPANPVFDPNDAESFNDSSSVTIYDSLGNPHVQTSYYVRSSTPNQWDVYSYVDGQQLTSGGSGSASLTFNTSGNLATPADGKVVYDTFDFSTVDPTLVAENLDLTVDLLGTSQFGNSFNVGSLGQDGLTSGRLTGIDIDETGIVFARFSNGGSTPMGQIAMVKFPNVQGLTKLGDSTWAESADSGVPISGVAGNGSFGGIQAGALEGSNVDIAQQLVKLIIAQQAYQANAEVISTQDQAAQTILNIR